MKNTIKKWLGITEIEEVTKENMTQISIDINALIDENHVVYSKLAVMKADLRVLFLEKEIMGLSDAAEELNMSVTAVKRLIYDGELEASKISNVWVLNKLSIGRYKSNIKEQGLMAKDISDAEITVSKTEE